MFLHKHKDARIAFQQQIVRVDKGWPIHNIICNVCGTNELIKGLRFVCKTCPDQDRCESCMQHYAEDTEIRCCRGHTFLQIPGSEWNSSEVREGSEKGINEWLKALMEQYTANGLSDLDIGTNNGSGCGSGFMVEQGKGPPGRPLALRE